MNRPHPLLGRWLSCVLAGAATAFGYAPLGWWPVWLLAVAYFLVRLDDAPWRHQLWMGWVFGLSAAIATTHWIGIALWHEAGMPKGVALTASAIAWGYSAWPWGLVGMLSAAMRRFAASSSSGLQPAQRMTLLVALLLAWWSQAWWLGGFPWLVPAAVWLDTPLQAWGPIGGGLLMAGCGGMSALVMAQAWIAHQNKMMTLKNKAQTASILIVIWGAGAVLQTVSWTHPQGPPVRVGAVQVDMPSQNRLDRTQEHAYQRMAWRITDALIQRHDVQVIVWPEALVRSAEIPLRTWLTQHDELLQGRSLVLGGIISVVEGEGSRSKQAHNSLLAYGPNSHGRYNKRELVPMTEQWPDSGPWPWLAAWADAQPWLQRGAEVQTPLSVAGHAVGASICYEDAFAHIYQGLPPTVGWLINASNDGWFAHTPVMPAQHLALSRLRALEQQKPLVRAANIGPSAMISANGHVLTQTTLGRPQLLYADLQPHQGHTPYARWGHGWLLLAVSVVGGWGGRFLMTMPQRKK